MCVHTCTYTHTYLCIYYFNSCYCLSKCIPKHLDFGKSDSKVKGLWETIDVAELNTNAEEPKRDMGK